MCCDLREKGIRRRKVVDEEEGLWAISETHNVTNTTIQFPGVGSLIGGIPQAHSEKSMSHRKPPTSTMSQSPTQAITHTQKKKRKNCLLNSYLTLSPRSLHSSFIATFIKVSLYLAHFLDSFNKISTGKVSVLVGVFANVCVAVCQLLSPFSQSTSGVGSVVLNPSQGMCLHGVL